MKGDYVDAQQFSVLKMPVLFGLFIFCLKKLTVMIN
jgi:hypothetical protein